MGSWAEEDIARIAGWRISWPVRLYHTTESVQENDSECQVD